MAVQDYKINYKSDFVLTINGDAGWATQFCIKFWTGMPSQAYFVGFDGVKYVNCRVGDTPTQLLVMFDDHHLPIGPLRMQIAYHTTIEEFPGSVFDEVTNARDVIVTIDGTDYQVMLDFTGEDAPELEFDLPAYANEAERIQNELQRQQNEAARIAAELQREQATAAAVQGAENVNAQLNGTTLTVTNRQGVSTSVNTKGEQGAQGPVGPEGPQGEQGVSIVSFRQVYASETATYYSITFSDGHEQSVAIPKGAKGDTGATGPTGPAGPQGQTGVSITDFFETGETETDTLYDIEFSDGTTKPVAIPKGEKGDQGEQGPEGPQGPMGDVAVITPEQQAAFTMYSTTGQNTNGPMTQKAVTDALVASSISYDNSQSGFVSNNVHGALDEIGDVIYVYETIDWVSQTTTLKYYINGASGIWVRDSNATTQRMCRIVPISPNSKYRITAQDDHPINFALLDNNNPAAHVGEVATEWNGGLPMVIDAGGGITIDSGEYTYLYIRNDHASASTNIKYPKSIEKRGSIKDSLEEVRTIYPLFTYDYIGGNTGEFTGNQASFENGKNIATPRFIKTSSAFKAKANAVGYFQVYYYDSELNFLKVIVTQYLTADVELELIPDVPHSYVKIVFQREEVFIKANISLTGIFEDNWDVFNVRPSNGYHRIGVMVDVSDAQCSDATTSTVQDEIDLRPNYGVIALPANYSNTGKPTRLIIYCHGACTHFTFSNATGFDTSKHVDPTYWLKEGYAVMDIDGNPMDATAHAFRPQAMEAYIAGYKWAIEHYNLYRDGVLLGGRSMGGGNTMHLLRSTCPIPVIASCANLPTSVAMGTSSSDKLQIANIRGFIIPDGFTFSDGPMNDEDTQVYYDNWEKGLRYIPSIALCVDTPTTEEWRKNFIKNCCHVGEPYESNRIAACKDLHMIVRSPFKMFGCFEDPNNGYQATAQLYMTMLGNAGQQAEYRLYHSYKATNYPSDTRSAHYYELADPTLRTTVTTQYGEEVTNVPMVYVEMLQFWRRYEQNM